MDENKIKDTAEAIKGIVEAVPIYEDLVQPPAKELGKGLKNCVYLALSPLSGLVWGFDKIKEKVVNSLEKKLENTPQENIITPNPRIAGPLLESLKYTAQEDELREMYTSLLASSMDKNKQDEAHPSFVEIIKQLQSDEARLLKEISSGSTGTHALLGIRKLSKEGGGTSFIEKFCKFYDSKIIINKFKIPVYIENLERLKIINIPTGSYLTNKDLHYKPLKSHSLLIQEIEKLSKNNIEYEFEECYLELTKFGKNFVKVCL